MQETRTKRIWISPQSYALSRFQKKRMAQPEAREAVADSAPLPPQTAKRQEPSDGKVVDATCERIEESNAPAGQALAVRSKGEPARQDRNALPAIPALPERTTSQPALPIPPELPMPTFSSALDLESLERTIRDMTRTLDLGLPEGWLDRWFGRPNHRVRVKAERAELITQIQTAMVAQLRLQCDAAEEVRRHNQIRYDQLLDALNFWGSASEAQLRVSAAEQHVAYEHAVEAAKARVELAKCERDIRDLRRDLAPPPPPPQPPLPPPPTEEERAQERRKTAQRAHREKYDLHLDETEAAANAGEEKVGRAIARATEIYRNVEMREGQKRARITEVLNAFGLTEDILPPAIQDLMAGGDGDDPFGGDR